jgi:hypothetical protein
MKNRWRTILLSLIAVLFFAVLLSGRSATEGFSPETQGETIFVSIASYRDKSCMNTVQELFAKAKHPQRVFLGICEQNTVDSSESCVPANFEHASNVRRISIPHTEAKGPTYARYLCSTLYRGETYFLQIDSHSTFVKDWDEMMIGELKATPDPSRAVLTGYPHDSGIHDTEYSKSVPILCDSKFSDEGIPMFLANVKSKQQIEDAKGKLFVVPFTSGGFIFAPGKMVREVPYDPYLDHIFQGEEVLFSARLWTHGYNFYTPRMNLLFHKYGRKDEVRWHADNHHWHEVQRNSMKRVKRLLHLEDPPLTDDPYALGTKRTIDEYWEFSGLDPKRRVSTSKDKFC